MSCNFRNRIDTGRSAGALIVLATCLLFAASACTEDGTGAGGPTDPGQTDVGVAPDSYGADAGDDMDAGDDKDVGDNTDAGDPPDTDTPPQTPPVRADGLCAAAGVAKGGGLTLYQCTGPVDPVGQVARGDGFRLQVGVTRLITP